MTVLLIVVLGVAIPIIIIQAGRLRHLQTELSNRDARIAKIKSAALFEVGKACDEATIRVTSAEARVGIMEVSTRSQLQASLDRERLLLDKLAEVAARPPVVIPAPNTAEIVQAIGQSVAHVAYGPERVPMTSEQAAAATYDLTRNLDTETLGEQSGTWMPDVEMDEWMEEYGVPNRPGWIAGTAPPMMQSSPDSHIDIAPISSAPRSNGDHAMFASGQGRTSMPPGGVE